MHIRFIKDYKCYQKGDIVMLKDWFAKKFVKGGFAEDIGISYKIDELYVAPIILPDKKDCFYTKGKVKHIGIFTRNIVGLINNHALYNHVVTNKTFISNDILGFGENYSQMVVDETKAQEFGEYYFDEMLHNGWSEYVRLSLDDIKKLEIKLNSDKQKQNDDRQC